VRFEFLRISSSMLLPGKSPFYKLFRPEMNFLQFGKGSREFLYSFVESDNQLFNAESTEQCDMLLPSLKRHRFFHMFLRKVAPLGASRVLAIRIEGDLLGERHESCSLIAGG
jgi:hypothetical protein